MPRAYDPTPEAFREPRQRRTRTTTTRTRKPRKEKATELSPEQEESTLKSVGKKMLGGIAAVGNALDTFTGASSVRDILAGENPFDQFLSPFSGENKTGGRELLTKWGLTKPNDPNKWELADFGGFAAEVALDPSSWAGVGLLGKGAKSAGILSTYAKGAGKVAKATGKVASKVPVVSRVAAPVGEAVDAGGRYIASLFDNTVRSGITKGERATGKSLTEAESAGISRAGKTSAKSLHHLVKQTGITEQQFRRMVEGIDNIPPEYLGAIQPFRDHFKNIRSRRRAIGASHDNLMDLFIKEYWPRRLSAKLPSHDTNFDSRYDPLRDVGEGTVTLENLAKDAVGMKDWRDIEKLIYSKYGSLIPDSATVTSASLIKQLNKSSRMRAAGELLNGPKLSKSGKPIPFVFKKGDIAPGRNKRLSKYLAEMSDDAKSQGIFGNHPLFDAQQALRNMEASTSIREQLIEILSDDATLDMVRSTSTSKDVVPITKVFRDLKLKSTLASAAIAARKRVAINDVMSMTIPKDYAEFLTRAVNGVAPAKWTHHPVVKAFDSFTALFKLGVLTWPATITRNFLSAMHRNWTAGMFSFGTTGDAIRMSMGKNVSRWEKYANHPEIKAMLAGRPVTAQTVTDALRERISAGGFVGEYQGAYGAAKAPRGTLDEMSASVPGGFDGAHPMDFAAVGRKATFREPGVSMNPFSIHGFRGRNETKFGLSLAAHDLNYFSESANRIGGWLHELERGSDLTKAAEKVTAAQVDYANRSLTPFERDIMTRAVPFYRFAKGNSDYVMRELWKNPGGRLGKFIRAQRIAADDDQGLPDHVSARSPLEIGKDNYLTGAGLMHEDFGEMFGAGIGGGLAEMASRLHPLAKAPFELASGQSFFQRGASGGRDLTDLDPTIGRTISNVASWFGEEMPPPNTRSLDFVIGNSPLARIASTARTATDVRKGAGQKALNLLTGLRTTTVSPEQRDRALIDQIAAEMKADGGRTFSETYFPSDMELSDDQAALKALLGQVRKRQRNRRKEKQKQKK